MSSTSNATYGAISVGSTAAQLVAANGGRRAVKIQNTHATQILYVGDDASVTDANGWKIAAGASETFEGWVGPVYGYGSGAATTGRYFEVG